MAEGVKQVWETASRYQPTLQFRQIIASVSVSSLSRLSPLEDVSFEAQPMLAFWCQVVRLDGCWDGSEIEAAYASHSV
jgi:hypothetical protein